MKQKELNLLYSYILNNKIRLENEINTRQDNLRCREVGVVDCIELALAKERLNQFNQTINDIRILLNIEGVEK